MICKCGAAEATPKWFPYCSKICHDFWTKGSRDPRKSEGYGNFTSDDQD